MYSSDSEKPNENWSDLAALTNLAKRISGKRQIRVDFIHTNLVFTNGFTIFIPIKFKNNITRNQGFIAHEGGHIGYGSFEISFINLVNTLRKKYDLPFFIVKILVNVVEDVRINLINKKKFPGFYESLKAYTNEILDTLKYRIRKYGDIPLYINLFMEDYPDFQKKPIFRSRKMTENDWKMIKISKQLLEKTQTPNSSIIVCDQLCKVLKNYYIKKKVVFSRKKPSYSTKSQRLHYQEEPHNKEEIIYVDDDTYDSSEEYFDNELIEEKDSEIMEDPFYIDESYDYNSYSQDRRINETFISQVEDFSHNNEISEKSPLENSSEEIINKIGNTEFSCQELEKLVENMETINNLNESCNLNDLDNNESSSIECNALKNFIEKVKNDGFSEKDYEEVIQKHDKANSIEDFKNIFEKIKDSDLFKDELNEILSHLDDKNNRETINEEILKILTKEENLSEDEIELVSYLLEKNYENYSKEDKVKKIADLLKESSEGFEERLIALDNSLNLLDPLEDIHNRRVIESDIKDEIMEPIDLTYQEIQLKYKTTINKVKQIFESFINDSNFDTFQKRGRLNNKLMKAITSDFKYQKCFTRKIAEDKLGMLLLVDISGSMKGIKLEVAKIAMIMLCEALTKISMLRIVLFTGQINAKNIVVKDFNQEIEIKKIDKFGCHRDVKSNLDGLSMNHEASHLKNDEIIIIISDGQPAGTDYGLPEAVTEIKKIRKKFKVYAFSIDAKGDYLNQLYGDNWILTKSEDKTDLSEKIISFCKLVVKEFYK